MREAVAQIFHGASLIADAIAALCRGPQAAIEAPPEAASASSPAPPPGDAPHDPMRALLQAIVTRFAKAPMEASPTGGLDPVADAMIRADIEDAPAAAPIEPAAAPLVVQPCQELDRQARERGRREALAADALNALDVAAYYSKYLRTQPARAEEWVRCFEAIPGSAPLRLQQAFAQGGIPAWQTYAALWDEIRYDLEEAKRVTAALQAQHPDQPGDWLDADREGRVWFWLGDRPEVEPPTADQAAAMAKFAAAVDTMPADGDPRGDRREVRPDADAPLRIHTMPRDPETGRWESPDAVLAGRELLAATELPGDPT